VAPRTGDSLADDGRHGLPYASQMIGESRATEGQLRQLVDRVSRHERGVIVCGPLSPDEGRSAAIAALARRAGWPVLADPLSQLRWGAHVDGAPIIAHGDLMLRESRFAAAHRPEVVLRIGGPPASKALRLWLEAAPPEVLLLLDPGGGWDDPSQLASRVLRLDAGPLCRELVEALDGGDRQSRWCADFVEADVRVDHAVAKAIEEEDALLEPRAVLELARLLPDDALLHVSNSMPVRDLDAFLPAATRPLRVYCNRGANGIDGVVSSALGAAAAGRGRVVLLIGDVAMLHDLGGLLAARQQALDLTVVVLNNDGGGIFSFLPIADHGESVGFETLYRTPHGLDFEPVAALFGLSHQHVRSWQDYRDALDASFARPGVTLIELKVDRDANLKHFRALVAVAGTAASAEPGA
jgi:2-succinyl-5-enolpyruvyl-6-hydroxy-3-cyclohexene-1-carboxylate synthase